MTTELRRLINLTAELQKYADEDIKQIQKELPKDEVLIIKAEHDLALSLLVRFGLSDYERSYIESKSAEDQGDFIIHSVVEDIKWLCDLAIKKDYNATPYQLKKLKELLTYVGALQDFFEYEGQ